MTFLVIVFALCIFSRCVILHQRGYKAWQGLIPGYNKYLLGKSCNCKKLGTACAIALPVWWAGIIGLYFYEAWLVQTYVQYMLVNDTQAQLVLILPENIKTWLFVFRYAMIAVSVVTIVIWSWLMLKFSQSNRNTNWMIIVWAVCPVLAYIYYVFKKEFSIQGKMFTNKKVPVNAKR